MRNVFLVCGSVGIALLFSEAALRLAYRKTLGLFQKYSSESLVALELKVPKEEPAHFNRQWGWTNFSLDKERLNSQGFRTQYDPKVNRRRVVLVGDSFVYGWYVSEKETLGSFLERELDLEVVNLGVRGYGIDQIALVAVEQAPIWNPEEIIVAFIAEDFERSCTNFSFQTRKPYFEFEGEKLTIKGRPVPTHEEWLAEHQNVSAKLKDLFLAQLNRSKTMRLLFEWIYRPKYQQCLTKLNPAILKWIEDHLSVPVKFVLLDGELPKTLDLKNSVKNFLDLSRLAPDRSDASLRHPDGHPKALLNQRYARAIAQQAQTPIP